jgi:hypothetical protein
MPRVCRGCRLNKWTVRVRGIIPQHQVSSHVLDQRHLSHLRSA